MCCNLQEVLIFTDNSSASGGHGKVGLMGIKLCMQTVFLLKRESGSSRVVSMTQVCDYTDGINAVEMDIIMYYYTI